MFSPYLRRIIIDVLLAVAFALGVFYIDKVFLDFLISLFHFSFQDTKLNLSSLAYCIMRSVFIFIPLIMLTVRFKKVPKNTVLKILFITIGVCYLVANTWIVYFVLDGNSLMTLLRASVPSWIGGPEFRQATNMAVNALKAYQSNGAYVFNYLVWDSYDLFAILFSTIQGVLYIKFGLGLEERKKIVLKKYIVISVLSLVIPFVYNIVVRGNLMVSSTWLERNALLIFESLFVIIAMYLASSSRHFWEDILW